MNYIGCTKKHNFEGNVVDGLKKHNFGGILVVGLDYNRILKKEECINMLTTEF
jgi:altronate dehydratase